jgi:hypothetical protein
METALTLMLAATWRSHQEGPSVHGESRNSYPDVLLWCLVGRCRLGERLVSRWLLPLVV